MASTDNDDASTRAWSVAKGPTRWPTAVILIVGFILTTLVFITIRNSEQDSAIAAFDAAAREHRSVIQTELTEIADSLAAVTALFASSDSVTRAEFRSFTHTIIETNPDVLAISWLPRVAAAEREAFESAARREGVAEYQINERGVNGNVLPAAHREEYFPALYIEPFEANRLRVGLDHSILPLRSKAMAIARQTGEPIATTVRIPPPRTQRDRLNIAMFSPRYVDPPDAPPRAAALIGFVSVMFNLGDTLSSERVMESSRGIALELRLDEADGELVFLHGAEPNADYPELRSEGRLDLPGLKFDTVSYATADFQAAPQYGLAWGALVAGILATILAAAYLESLARRLRAHQELQSERDRLFKLSPDLLTICGFDGVFREVNPHWQKALGYTREELLSRRFFDFVHPDDIAPTTEQLAHLREGGEVIDFSNRYRSQEGSWHWLQWRCIPMPDQQLIYGIARDITRQLEIDSELREANRFKDRIAEVVPCVLYVYDLQLGRAVYVNRRADLPFGELPKRDTDAGSSDMRHWIHPEDRARLGEQLQKIKRLPPGEASDFMYRVRNASDQQWRWFHGRDTVFERDAAGNAIKIIGAATDITAIKQAEEALRENAHRLDFVLSAANMGVWEMNFETGQAVWSETVARVFGLPFAKAPQTFDEFLELVHPEDRERERRLYQEALATGSVYQSEFRRIMPDGSIRWIGGIGKFVLDESGRPQRLFGLGWDGTARKQAEAERARFEEQARQSHKMEALGTLAGGIAHDFNNILTAVSGNARLALEELPSGHPAKVCIDEIRRGAARATDLVRRILAFSRNEEPVLRALDMRAIVEDAVRLLRAVVPAMIEIRLDVPDDLPPVLADVTQLHQVIMNLGTNARDAMSERGGVLTIALQVVPMSDRLRSLAPEMQGDKCVCLSVSDSGPGMPPHVLDRVFEPFFTTKGPGQGTGMGLSMVHGIVHKHHGAIVASSEVGHGARFDLYFPIAASSAESLRPAQPKSPTVGQGERLMYVDDEEALVFLAQRMLTKMGFVVVGHTDAKEALRVFKEDPSSFDMVITDLGMPGMSGIEFATELLKVRPTLPVIITSGFVRAEDSERARRIGVGEIVLKPNTVEEMAHLFAARLAAVREQGEERNRQAQPS